MTYTYKGKQYTVDAVIPDPSDYKYIEISVTDSAGQDVDLKSFPDKIQQDIWSKAYAEAWDDVVAGAEYLGGE